MIEFKHKLPSMNIDGKRNGTYNNRELGFPSVLTTDDYRLGVFIDDLRSTILKGRSLVFIDNKILSCLLNWIRDHSHIMKAAKHWEYDLTSFLDFIIDTQREDGQFFELIKQYDDYHWKFVNEDCYRMYEEDNVALVRLEIEADIEYLVVECAEYVYHVLGDDEWLRRVLPKLEKGIDYITSDEKRWDKEHGLVKRGATIDTWDFTDDPKSHENRRIEADTPMSIMHGDNTGVFHAMKILAWFNRRLNDEEKAQEWEKRAEELRQSIMKHLWNGRFFMHQLHLNHSGVDNRENERLSLSNSYALNREVLTLGEAQALIGEYRERRKTTKYFAEWFTIDPPYECFGGNEVGKYVNGAISPFTAGELAKGAFNNGCEEYGWDIISRFIELVERDGTAHFLYFPDSTPQPAGGPSAWGAAALISAVDEGLAGITDMGVCYDEVGFSPKFPVTHYTELRYLTGYEVNKTKVDVRYILEDNGMRYDIYSPAKTVNAHILLPKGKTSKKLLVNGCETAFDAVAVGASNYVDARIEGVSEKVSIEVLF